ncbi:hypothetical protein K474DRAFT_1302949 [Panus rudis PR-1116 ss-1]|nr:hypothetical protein K474DRAFT_1302949 [Panus rudis PR-1116 ss-1]
MHSTAFASFIVASSWAVVGAVPQGSPVVSVSSSPVSIPSSSVSSSPVTFSYYSSSPATSFDYSSSAAATTVVSASVSAIQSCHTDGVPVTVTIIAPSSALSSNFTSATGLVDRRADNVTATISAVSTFSNATAFPTTTVASNSTAACAPTVTVSLPSNDNGTTTIISGTVVGSTSASISQSGVNPNATDNGFNSNGAGSLRSMLGGVGVWGSVVAVGFGLLM